MLARWGAGGQSAQVMPVFPSPPGEIWLQILAQLSMDDIRTMAQVNRTFRSYSRAFIWQTLTLCTVDNNRQEKIQRILRDPDLTPYVKHLRFFHSQFSGRYNLWFSTTPVQTKLGMLKQVAWAHPITSFRRLYLSQRSIDLAVAIVPRLTNIRRLSISVAYFLPTLPNLDPYRKLWSSLHLDRLRCLDLKFFSRISMQLVSEAIRDSSIVFTSLKVMILDFAVYNMIPTLGLEEDIRRIASLGRMTIRSLSISSKNASEELAGLFAALDFFPKLLHLYFSSNGNRSSYTSPDVTLRNFITKHKSTLVHLSLKDAVNTLFPSVQALAEGKDPESCPTLESIQLVCQRGLLLPTWSVGNPVLTPYSSTLTTLIVDRPWSGQSDLLYGCFGFEYEEILTLIQSLYKSPNGCTLRRLKVPIRFISPQLFDALAMYLEQLDTLDVLYGRVVGHRNSSTRESQASFAPSDIEFFRGMRLRGYPNWRLRALNMRTEADKETPNDTVTLLRFLAQKIPS
ncbi:hypothetical protein BDN72DRAFT_963744, partial [Pluteus cervinus]